MLKTTSTEFTSVVKGKNFITPTINGYFISGNYIVELSRGTDFEGNRVYGVTVVDSKTMTHDREKSQLCNSLAEANAYIKQLGKE